MNCVICDPPFGVNNKSKMAVTEAGKKYARKIANDESPELAISIFMEVMCVLLPLTSDDCDLYVFTSYQVLKEWLEMTDNFLSNFGFSRKGVLVWEKDGPGLGDVNLPWGMGCEFILYFQKGKRDKSATRRNNVIHIPQIRPNKLIHPHEKPVPLLELLITASTNKGDFIVDPFGGSGSLVRAARRTERSAVAIELDEENYNLAVKAFNDSEGGGMEFGD